jgi:septin 7
MSSVDSRTRVETLQDDGVNTSRKSDFLSTHENGNVRTPSKVEQASQIFQSTPEINSVSGEPEVAAPIQTTSYFPPSNQDASYHPAAEVRVQTVVHSEEDGVQYNSDVRAAFSGVPKIRPHWVERYMKILVVGESGLGKTTFIKNIFASYAQDANLKVNDVPGATSKEEFVNNPEKLMTEIVVKDVANMTAFHYRVQDTPGYDNLEVTLDPVLDYIKAQQYKALEHEQNAKRVHAMTKFEDPRVDVCVYFIAPHRLKPIDVEFIKKLCKEVPVIPVLAKADSMTTDELESFREHVRKMLYHAAKDGKTSLAHQFSRQALWEAGAAHEVPPFAVVASNVVDLSVGRFWPVRKYPWGTCEAMSSRHSDLAALKKLLFEVSYMELKDATEERYYRYRESQLLNLDDETMPLSRKTLTRQLQKMTRPKPPSRGGVLKFLGTAARWTASGVLVYLAVSALQGRQGRQRLRHDVEVIKEKTSELTGTVAEKGEHLLNKSQEAGQVVVSKAKDVKNKAAEVLESAEDKAKREAEEKRRKRRRGPFGIFPPAKN